MTSCLDDDDDDPFILNEINMEEVATGMTSPIAMAVTPNDDDSRLFFVDQTGEIHIVENGTILSEPFLDISSRMVSLNASYDERGMLGLAFHPNYETNGRFFVFYSVPLRPEGPQEWNNTATLSEFTVSQDPNRADATSERIIMEIDEPQGNHAGGTIAFGFDGYLYISLGDGGGADDTGMGHTSDWYDVNEGGNAQNIDNLPGSILRIDVDAGDPYGIPASNPFVGIEGRDEIFAYGLRNPYRMSFDRVIGDHYAGDAGQLLYEEVNLIVVAGGNSGWNVTEGRSCFNALDNENPLDNCPIEDGYGNALLEPIIEFRNTSDFPQEGLGVVVVGGYVYRGEDIDGLDGSYVFGTYSRDGGTPTGDIFYAETNPAGL